MAHECEVESEMFEVICCDILMSGECIVPNKPNKVSAIVASFEALPIRAMLLLAFLMDCSRGSRTFDFLMGRQ